jgi:hypothetical protein
MFTAGHTQKVQALGLGTAQERAACPPCSFSGSTCPLLLDLKL